MHNQLNFVFENNHYRPKHCRPAGASGVSGSPYDANKFSRVADMVFPHIVFVAATPYYEIVDWVTEHTFGRWSFEGTYKGYWAVRFEQVADAVKMKLAFSACVEPPDEEFMRECEEFWWKAEDDEDQG